MIAAACCWPRSQARICTLPNCRCCWDMVNRLVELQRRWGDCVEELLALGLPIGGRRRWVLRSLNVIARTRDAKFRRRIALCLRTSCAGFPTGSTIVDRCGLRDTLVHGDFHPGNFRGDDRALTLLDWGDSGVGHPLLDQPAFLDAIPAPVSAPCGRTGCNNGVPQCRFRSCPRIGAARPDRRRTAGGHL